MIATGLTLVACSGKGGGSSANGAGATGVCTVDAYGQCVGGTVYNGTGRWNGVVSVAGGQYGLYQQFLLENGLCSGYACQTGANPLRVSISLNGGNQGYVIISSYYSNRGQRLSRRANVYNAGSANGGFNMVLIDNRQYLGVQPYPTPIMAPNNTIQLNNIFASSYGNIITTSIYYRGVVIATGQLQGYRNVYGGYPQTMNRQAPQIVPMQQ